MATTKVAIVRDRRRSSSWVVRWYGVQNIDTGRVVRYSEAFRKRTDAVRFQAERQAELDNGARRDRPKDIALGDFCRLYMERRGPEWREKTRLQIVDLTNRLIRYFGDERLFHTITPEDAARFWASARNVKRESVGKELSRYTRNRILRDAKTLFKHAVEWSFLKQNPFDRLKQLRVSKKSHRPWHYIQPHEYRALLCAVKVLRWKVIYSTAYCCGLRSGELFNLTEDCVDFDHSRLIVKSREGSDTMPPFFIKDYEDREIPMPRHTARLLRGWLRVRDPASPLILLTTQRYERVRDRWHKHREAGLPWLNDYLVNNLPVSIRRHANWAGIKLNGALTMHAFRKSCAQNWANHLPMNVVREFMGHADIATTAEFYSAVSEEHWQRALEVTGRLRVVL